MASSSTTITLSESDFAVVPISQPKKSAYNVFSREIPDPLDDVEMKCLPPSGAQTPRPLLSSISRMGSSENVLTDTHIQQTIWNPYRNRYRVMAACLTVFPNALNDSAPGALLASIEKYYKISYGTVSIIFVCNALGFLAVAFFISSLAVKIGRAKVLMISAFILMCANATIVSTPPFPVVCTAFFFLGIGMAMNLAICQVFIANLANNTALIGIYQGTYGIGGTIGPLIATSLVNKGELWSRFYAIQLGLAFLNFFVSSWAFWGYEQESASGATLSLPQPASPARKTKKARKEKAKKTWVSFKNLLSNKPTVLGSLFMFSYQGAEVAISGWVISFLVEMRHGDPSKVGYVTSGFWGGITLGRFTLSFLAHRLGERRFVFLVTLGAFILEFLIWFVPSIPGDSVAVAISGFLLGPVSPCSVHIIQRLVPRKMQIAALGLIGSIGSCGGAVAPFMTGIIAQRVGTFVLHPICIGLFCCMALTWWCLPDPDKEGGHDE